MALTRPTEEDHTGENMDYYDYGGRVPTSVSKRPSTRTKVYRKNTGEAKPKDRKVFYLWGGVFLLFSLLLALYALLS